MTVSSRPVNRELEATLWKLYRSCFDHAEQRRRWSLRHDIPWNQLRPNLDPVLVEVLETLYTVELFLPDYTALLLRLVRFSPGRVWFHANWAYEESRHSLALGDWLRESGQRSEADLARFESCVLDQPGQLPHAHHLAMLVHALLQERVMVLIYRHLRHRVEQDTGDPALLQLLQLLAEDEQQHADFLLEALQLYWKAERAALLAEMPAVLRDFTLPALDRLPDGTRRLEVLSTLGLFDQELFQQKIVAPLLKELGVREGELGDRPGREPARQGDLP
jgi:acyl-[acyl-carrier-protein] desaturase